MMKFLLLGIIRTYWILVPEFRRRKCIFKNSCSNYVYEITEQKGFINGMRALKFRINNCKPEFDVFTNPITGQRQMILRDGQIVDENEIAERLK
jgi:uncharacterized protein